MAVAHEGTLAASRLRAMALLAEGVSASKAARELKVSVKSVLRWKKTARDEGLQALCAIPVKRLGIGDDRPLREAARGGGGRLFMARVRALIQIAEGKSAVQVGKASGLKPATIRKWIELYQQGGIAGLRDKRVGPRRFIPRPGRRLDLSGIDAQHARELAAQCIGSKQWKRLRAVAFVAEGMTPEQAGAKVGLGKEAVRKWCVIAKQEGLNALLRRPHVVARVEDNAAELRAMARHEPDGRVARKLLVLANVAEGMEYTDAGRPADVSIMAVVRLLNRFRAGGVEALRTMPSQGRTPRLSTGQVRELRGIVAEIPGLTVHDLVPIVRQRFGVSYKPAGLVRLLKASNLNIPD
jgi:transposase